MHAVVRRLWRVWLRVYFLLFQRHRHNRVTLEWPAGQPIVVLPQVLNPVLFHTGEFLARSLGANVIPPGATVLDMGCGSGIGGIFALTWAGRVVAVDINPEAVRCARINALLHGVETRMDVREGDLFAPVMGERFDVVLFNPPYLRGEPRGLFDRALWATDVVERFAAGLPARLAPGGHALVLLSSAGDEAAFLDAFRAQGLAVEPIAARSIVSETLTIYRLSLGIGTWKNQSIP
jgi:release factor glutamine methyltransferase